MVNLLKTYGWHEWLCHTNFSFLTGASHPDEYLERAAALGYGSLSVTDFDGVYGLARCHRNLKRLREEGKPGAASLRFCKGMELHLGQDHDLPVIFRDTLALVAQTRQGYGNICKLASYAHRDGKKKAYVPLAALVGGDRKNVTDVVAIQPMRGLIRRTGADPVALAARLGALKEHFGGRLYLAVSRHLNPGEDTWVPLTLRLARRLGLPCLLSQDAFFHAPERKTLSDLLHAIRTNKTLDQAVAHMFVNTERCLHDLGGIERRFRDLPVYAAALRASRELADSCTFDMKELVYKYPKEMIPDGYTAQGFLEHLVWEATHKRYHGAIPDKVKNLLIHELALIRRLKFPHYFLTVWDIVSWARSQGILCQGRGSAANSAVCFVLGITSVDPSTYDMLFERFVSVERGDPPDIDVDFEHERREEVIQYIYRRYGRDRAAMVANVITYRRKGALRAVGKALGLGEDLIGGAARLLEARYFRGVDAEVVIGQLQQDRNAAGPGVEGVDEQDDAGCPQLVPAEESVKQGEPQATEDSLPLRLWAELAEALKGFPRHLGIHSGGFMLANKSLNKLIAQEPATMPGRSIVQWCKEDIEGLGFFKIDILALGMLTAIRKAFAAVEQHKGVSLTIAGIPPGDELTYKMIRRADTVGTFQIESRAQMSMLPRLKPKNFYDLVVEVAIVRPGPIQGGMIHPYLRRREDRRLVSYPDPRLVPILERTLGIPLFQEQVMRIAIAVGGFTPGESNELRRHMGAWSMQGDIGPWIIKMADGMRKNGLAEDFIHSILEQMKGFAHYGFPESHAVSFALLAYVSSYLKRHYPTEFFQSLLNSQPMGFYSPHALLQAAQRDDVKILPVCANSSHWDSTLERIDSGTLALRLGMRLVNSLSRKGADELVRARTAAGGRFRDLTEILRTASLYRSDLTALAAAGGFSAFGLERKAAIWLAEAAPFSPVIEDVEDPVAFTPESSMDAAEQDFAATSTTLGPHPAAIIRAEHWCYEVTTKQLRFARDISQAAAGRPVDVFGMVLVRQSPPSAGGMVFLTMEDDTGFLNLALTPDKYARFYDLIERQSFLCVRGKLQRQGESHSILVTHVYPPLVVRGDVIPLQVGAGDQQDAATGERFPGQSRNYM